MIDWSRIEAGHFERIVDVLLRDAYDEDALLIYSLGDRLVFPDGRGGDGGRDAELIGSGRHLIFQLKHFVDGFPASNRSRRRQITDSFDTAMRHRPTHWLLVVPAKVTDGERDFVNALASRASAPQGLVVEVIDLPWLDERAARRSDVDFYFTRSDEVLERVRLFHAETAMLDGPDDLAARVRALGGVADARDVDWTVDFSREGEVVTQTLRARHGRAHEVSPITIGFDVRIDDADGDLAQALRASLGYGEPGAVTVPASSVARLQVEGPPWLRQDESEVEVTWYPTPAPPPFEQVEVRFLDQDGRLLAAEEGEVTHGGQGWEGFSLHARFHGTLTFKWRFPRDESQSGKLIYTLQMAKMHPGPVLGSITVVRLLHHAAVVELWLGEHRLAAINAMAYDDDPSQWLRELDGVALLAEDLDVVQRHCHQRFPIPETLTRLERIGVRAARLLLEGRRVAHPYLRTFTRTIDLAAEAGLRSGLETLVGGGQIPACFTIPDLVLSIGHRELRLGAATVYVPNAVAADPHALRAAVEAEATDAALQLRAADGGLFSCVLPAHVHDEHQQLPLTPWGLPELAEPDQA